VQDFSETYAAHLGGNPSPEVKNKQQVVHFNFRNSNEISQILKSGKSTSYCNYFIGKDKSKWASDVRSYSEATLKNLYAGIDLKLIEKELELKYEFHVAPKVNPNTIVVDIVGADELFIDAKGKLNVRTQAGQILEEKPFAYQVKNGKIVEIPCQFELNGNALSFKLGSYNSNLELIIDPTLVFATYSGSVTDNFGMTATFGQDGTAFSGGTIFGNAYPTPDNNAYDVTSNFTVANNAGYGITDVFISKYAKDGSTMLWTTFLGGGNDTQGTETVHSLITDKMNNLYLFGATSSVDFPIVNGYQSTHAGGTNGSNYYYNGVYYNTGVDMYVAKLSADGHNLLGSTYMGGSGNDGINYKISSGIYSSYAAYDSLTNNYGDQFRGEIMLDQLGNCLVASSTRSTDFPVKDAFQPTNGGGQDGVVFKLSPDLSTLVWSSYYGGTNNDACYSVKVDSSYNVVIAGGTGSSNLLGMSGAWQSSYNGGKADGYVLKLTPDGHTIKQATYVGTNQLDQAFFVEIDRFDKVYLYGVSNGGTFPIHNASYSKPNSTQFVAKINENLTALENSTVFGNGNNAMINISPSAFMVDICGNIYISGWGANILQNTPLSGMDVTAGAFQATPPNGYDFYLMVMKRDFSGIIYGTYLGGNQAQEHVDGGTSRFDKNGVVYQSVCAGCGGHSDFPTTPGAWSNINKSSNCNNILFKFDFNLTPKADFSADKFSGCAPLTVTFNNFSSTGDDFVWDFGNSNLDSTTFNPTKTFNTPGSYDVYLYVTDSICQITDTAKITINVSDSLLLDVPNVLAMCQPASISVKANSYGLATTWQWSSTNQFTDNLNSSPQDSVLTVTPTANGYYYVKASNAYCTIIDSVEIQFLSTSVHLSGTNKVCYGDTTHIFASNQNTAFQLTYVWSPTNAILSQPSDNHVIVKPDTSMYVYVTATSADGCVFKDSIWIDVNMFSKDTIVASASKNHVLNGEKVTLSATPSGYPTYSWTPTDGLTSPNAQTTDAKINGTTIYTVTAKSGGCSISDTVIVFGGDYACDKSFVYLPNAFTPNGDGDNDILFVRSAVAQKILLRVFNRWGQLVFETENQHVGWDGTFKGRPCDPDVYDYYLKVTCVNEQENIIKGNVTLIR
jgi:gliding motility-associated-like protein